MEEKIVANKSLGPCDKRRAQGRNRVGGRGVAVLQGLWGSWGKKMRRGNYFLVCKRWRRRGVE